MTDLFASESKQDILTTLNKYVLDEAWVKRINSHLLNSVDSYQPNEEEKSHSLFESFQTYSNLIKERLLDFITDYPKFGTSSVFKCLIDLGNWTSRCSQIIYWL